MSGLPGWDITVGFSQGWYQQSAGIPSVYLAILDQGFLSATTDTPASTPFLARIKNAADFAIDRQHSTWVEGTTPNDGAQSEYAAYGQLDIDDPDGEFDFLLSSDIKDAVVAFQLPFAAASGTLAGAPTVATAIIDDVQRPDSRTKRLILKDTLALFDQPMPVRRVPTFMDAGAARRSWPMLFGACRNVDGLVIDSVNRLIALHDGQITNIADVRDNGAPLSRRATPPQFVPAMNGQGIQLAADGWGKILIDCSSEGAQGAIPGVTDALGGLGEFGTWPSTYPSGWSWSNNAGSQVLKRGTAQGYSQDFIASLGSTRPWSPNNSRFGDYLSLTSSTPLKSGRAYRITFQIHDTFGAEPFFAGGMPAGLMLRSAISNLEEDAISPHGWPLTVPMIGDRSFGFTHRVPVGADRNIYLVAVSAAGSSGTNGMGLGGGLIYNVRAEELGEFVELPMRGITMKDYYQEILHDRAGLSGTWEPADLEALDTAAGYLFGVYFSDVPTIAQAIRAPLPSFGATLCTDAAGKARVPRLVAPEDVTIVAAFNLSCVDRDSIHKRAFKAPALTNQIGAARNWVIPSESELVSDTDVLPREVKERYQRLSQYIRTSSIRPAQEYAHAFGNAPLDSLIDDPDQAQLEIDRINSMFAYQIIDGVEITGRRQLVDFDVYFNDAHLMGVGTQIEPYNLLWGDGVTLDSPEDDFNTTPMVVVGYKYFPWAQKMTITGLY
jgi:hypothetical protein